MLQPLAKVVYPTVPRWENQILARISTSQTKAQRVWMCFDLYGSVAYGSLVYSAMDIVLGQPWLRWAYKTNKARLKACYKTEVGPVHNVQPILVPAADPETCGFWSFRRLVFLSAYLVMLLCWVSCWLQLAADWRSAQEHIVQFWIGVRQTDPVFLAVNMWTLTFA